MLKVTKAMLANANELRQDKTKTHTFDGMYDYFTTNHETVAIVRNAVNYDSMESFRHGDFAVLDSYDFN